MAKLGERLKRSWNAFLGRDPTSYGPSFSYDPSVNRHRYGYTGANTIVKSIYNRIAVDCSQIDIRHVRLNENGQFLETIDSGLDECLFLSPNLDQTAEAFIRDVVLSMFEEGVVAIVPFETDANPNYTDSYDILGMRCAKIVEWRPAHVVVEVYNQWTGQKERMTVQKRFTPIVENPFYETMNEPNSVLQRLIRVLAQLDDSNSQLGSDKLDLLIQLPYTIKTDAKKEHVAQRKANIEDQLHSGRGIAYIDATEKVVQLNRPIENTLLEQAKSLETQLYNELGLTQSVFDGTADESTLLNYYNRTIEPILSAITREMLRKWISKTARTQKQSIMFFRDPFKLVPVNDLAEIADKFTRNEIMSSNEIRAIIGMKRSDDAKADQLVNSNINYGDQQATGAPTEGSGGDYDTMLNEFYNNIDSDIDEIIGGKTEQSKEGSEENVDDTKQNS